MDRTRSTNGEVEKCSEERVGSEVNESEVGHYIKYNKH
jgi:ADP-dependent phosphofructokinase/glucokinase